MAFACVTTKLNVKGKCMGCGDVHEGTLSVAMTGNPETQELEFEISVQHDDCEHTLFRIPFKVLLDTLVPNVRDEHEHEHDGNVN